MVPRVRQASAPAIVRAALACAFAGAAGTTGAACATATNTARGGEAGAHGSSHGPSNAPSSGAASDRSGGPIDLGSGPAVPRVALAGARCHGAGAACACRASGDDAESEPPAPGSKRFEIRIAADGGEAVLDSPTLGRLTGKGSRDTCYYVDVVGGSSHGFTFKGRAANVDRGFAPRLTLREYGPKGPWWYDVVTASCDNGTGRCDRAGADAWGHEIARRKRGRLDPCGSAVVTGLDWETSGGLHQRDGGTFEDFKVDFTMEVKKFATQFAPGSTECVPK